jgi:hypothetical protein
MVSTADVYGRGGMVAGQIRPPGHDELRYVLFLINGTVMEDLFREEVSSTPLGTVRPP